MLIPAERGIGLTSVCLGVTRAMERKGIQPRIYKPIAQSYNENTALDRTTAIIRASTNLPTGVPLKMSKAEAWLSANQQDALMESIVAGFNVASQGAEVVFVEGLVPSREHPFVQSLNISIAKILNAEIILVMTHRQQSPGQLHESMRLACNTLGSAKNRLTPRLDD